MTYQAAKIQKKLHMCKKKCNFAVMKKDAYSRFARIAGGIAVVLLVMILIRTCRSCHTQDMPIEESEVPDKIQQQPIEETHLVSYPGRSIKYSEKFRDLNAQHLAAAQAIGLSHRPANRDEAAKMRKELTLISTNKNYIVEDLTHSIPYLVPTAAHRLDALGEEFADILERNHLPHYRFCVSSVLRSLEDVKRLQRSGNVNATDQSAHNYGTTFDIAYWRYDKVSQTADYMTDDNLKLVLAQVLLNQQRAGHIYVKYEAKQCCFHITVRD